MKTVKSTVSQTLSDAGCGRTAACGIENLLNAGKKLLGKPHTGQRNLPVPIIFYTV